MLTRHLIDQVRQLIGEGKNSLRMIARLTGVSRGTVRMIALGKRRDREPKKVEPWEAERPGPPQRCPTCGGKVYMPCRLCAARSHREPSPAPRKPWTLAALAGPAIGLDLRPEHRRRYEEIKEKRRANATLAEAARDVFSDR